MTRVPLRCGCPVNQYATLQDLRIPPPPPPFPRSNTTTDPWVPASQFRFEDPKNITIDSGASGAIHLDVPNCTAHIASYIRCPKQVGTGGPVGGFLDFAASPNATVKTSWGAKIPINISDSWDGFTIEFLLKPGPRFLRGGYSDLFSSLASGGQPTVRPPFVSPPFVSPPLVSPPSVHTRTLHLCRVPACRSFSLGSD